MLLLPGLDTLFSVLLTFSDLRQTDRDRQTEGLADQGAWLPLSLACIPAAEVSGNNTYLPAASPVPQDWILRRCKKLRQSGDWKPQICLLEHSNHLTSPSTERRRQRRDTGEQMAAPAPG